MFEKNYIFYGKHAKYVDDIKNANIFNRFLDILIISPIIGFLYNERAELDNDANTTSTIFSEQLIKESAKLKYIFKLLTLLDEDSVSVFDERINRAFRYREGREYEQSLKNFNSYVRGGVEFLHKKIFDEKKEINFDTYLDEDYEESLKNYFSFIQKFHNDLEIKDENENVEEIINEFDM